MTRFYTQALDKAEAMLGLPRSIIRVFACPVCGRIASAGMLGPGSEMRVICDSCNCPHHYKNTPWIVKTEGIATHGEKLRIWRCPSTFTTRPCIVRRPEFAKGGKMCPADVNYDNGNPVCNLPVVLARLTVGTKILFWCKERSCANAKDGFIIESN